MKWVLNTYQTAQDWDVDEMIEIARKTGYQGIEFLQDFKQKHGWEWDAEPSLVSTIRQKMADAGLEIASLTSCQRFDSLVDTERRASVDRVRRVIEMARDVGCSQVRVLGDRLPEDGTREQVLQNVAACLRELGQFAQPMGVTVLIEMHGSFTDPGHALDVIRRADNPNVGFVFNSQFRVKTPQGWQAPAPGQSIASLYDEIRPYLRNIHTHQMERPETLENYRELFGCLKRDGYQGYVSNECAYRGPDPEKVRGLYTALFRAFSGP